MKILGVWQCPCHTSGYYPVEKNTTAQPDICPKMLYIPLHQSCELCIKCFLFHIHPYNRFSKSLMSPVGRLLRYVARPTAGPFFELTVYPVPHR